jgi:hypothetical protein
VRIARSTDNRYAYVGNNPLRYVDPTGHKLTCRIEEGGCDDGTPYTQKEKLQAVEIGGAAVLAGTGLGLVSESPWVLTALASAAIKLGQYANGVGPGTAPAASRQAAGPYSQYPIDRATIIRSLRELGTPQARAVEQLIKRDIVKLSIEEGTNAIKFNLRPGIDPSAYVRKGTDIAVILPDNILAKMPDYSVAQAYAATVAGHEAIHVLQNLRGSPTDQWVREMEAYAFQMKVGPTVPGVPQSLDSVMRHLLENYK